MAKGPTKAELYETIMWAMDGDLLGKRLGPFPYRFYLARIDTGKILLRASEDDPAIVEQVDMEEIERAIAAFIAQVRLNLEGYNDFGPRIIAECARYWALRTAVVPEPRAFLWPGEDGMAFRRLPWPLAAGTHPTWDALLSKMTNAQAFKQWVGSLFVADSDKQQYVWIYGEGNDGKGAINRFLKSVFGVAYHATEPPPTTRHGGGRDKFWSYYAVIGKRLVVFPDCNDAHFTTSSTFKSLTGGDPIACEKKRGDPFTYIPKAKFLFFSNVKPDLSSAKADMRRVIYCEFDPQAAFIESSNFEGTLWGEGGPFLHSCIVAYAEACPGRGLITSDGEAQDALDNWVSTLEERFEEIFNLYFIHQPGSQARPCEVFGIAKGQFSDKDERKSFMSWMDRKYGIRKMTVRSGQDVGKKAYKNIKISYYDDKRGTQPSTKPTKSHLKSLE